MVPLFPKAIEVNNPSGRFSIMGVSPGVYDVIIAGPGFARRVLAGQSITQNEATHIGYIAVSRGRTIQGRVLDELGQPQKGAKVRLIHSGYFRDLDHLSNLALGDHVETTDNKGYYRIDNVTRIEPSEYPPRLSASIEHQMASGPHRVSSNVDEIVDLVIRPVGSIEGTVIGQPNRDREEEHIVVESVSTPNMSTLLAVPDEDGSFRVDDVPEGAYRVILMIDGRPSRQVTVSSGQTVTVSFSVP
jgi:hypothetical protein